MQGLSTICQNPRCSNKAVFCCERCLKRTYCSEKCQIMDWDSHKHVCFLNEKHDEIIQDIEKAKKEYGSAFHLQKKQQHKRNKSETKNKETKVIPKRKKAKQSEKVEIEYNGCLLPYCLETLNNSIIAFLNKFEENSEFGDFFMQQEDKLYHTSSISETVEVLQAILDDISTSEKHKEFANIEVTESIRDNMKLLSRLADHFKLPDLKERYDNQKLYSEANDYTSTSSKRQFCTNCGDNHHLVPHPILNHVYLCDSCLQNYSKNSWKQEDGNDCDCCCCGDGGNVVLCDYCHHSVCSNCIMLHMGEEEWQKVLTGEKWKCLLCKKDTNGKPIFAKDYTCLLKTEIVCSTVSGLSESI